MTDAQELSKIVKTLGLTPAKENWAYGVYEGVPLALNIVATTESAGLLFHVRYPSTQFASETPPLRENTLLAECVQRGQAEVSLDSKTGWLSLFSNGNTFTAPDVQRLLTEFFETVQAQGVDLKKRLCLVCTRQTVEKPGFTDNRLQLICEACDLEAKSRFQRENLLNPLQLPLLLIPAVIGALVGSLIWSGAWFTYDWVIGLARGGFVPTLLLALLYCGTGFLVAKPLTFFLSRVRNRGIHFGATLSVLSCLAALVLGETLLMAFLCLKVLKFLPPPSFIAHVYLSVMRELSFLYVGGKLVAAATALYFAYTDALPKKKAI
jgi:hypothetical protein